MKGRTWLRRKMISLIKPSRNLMALRYSCLFMYIHGYSSERRPDDFPYFYAMNKWQKI